MNKKLLGDVIFPTVQCACVGNLCSKSNVSLFNQPFIPFKMDAVVGLKMMCIL